MAAPFAYVIHWDVLAGRGEHVTRLINHLREAGRMLSKAKTGPPVRVVTSPNPDATDIAAVQKMIATDPALLPSPSSPQTPDFLTTEEHAQLKASMSGTLLLRQVSNAVKHHAALSDVGAASPAADREWRVVVEDDACTVQPPTALAAALASAPSCADIVMLGLPVPHQQPATPTLCSPGQDPGCPPLSRNFPVLPHCDSYAIRVGAARRMAALFMPVRFPTNVHLWWLARTLGLRIHFTSPDIMFVDGSKFGAFVSSIEINNRLWLSAPYCELEAAIRDVESKLDVGESPTKQLQQAAVATLTSLVTSLAARVPFRDHPDMKYLLARVKMLAGRTRAAEAMYKEALARYTLEGSPMGERSRFLLDHIAVYRSVAAHSSP